MRVLFLKDASTGRRSFSAGDVVTLDADELIASLHTGVVRLIGPAGMWEDHMFPAQATNPGGLSNPPTWDETHIGWSFPHTADKTMQIVYQCSHSWVEGSPLNPHIHMKTVGASTDKTITFTFKWRRARANSGVYSDWVTETDVTVDVPAAEGSSFILPFAEIDMTSYKVSSMLDFEISRKTGGGTDLGAAIIWKQFDVHRLVDSFGSGEEWVK